ncbi:MAG TPA: sugar transferase [Methylomirabilota bacterium]|jgi:lipopolysaccharide/colanic/teichoic acid biosynthesis glycosyltransferase|nr:sugar transferase [Methylomirabilota bacterium]
MYIHHKMDPFIDLQAISLYLEADSGKLKSEYGYCQRVFDFIVAALVLLLTSPLMLVIGILIRLDSQGPALFRQWRVGKGGKLFLFTKFRTFYMDAKERFPELYTYQYSPEEIKNLQFKVPDDPRVTRIGRWLRDSTLDELPNFWNVLTGDMALVGPRPEIPEMLPYYDQAARLKFLVKPGITGLAQVSGRGRLKFLETISYDLEYVRRRNFWFDLKILLMTIYKVVMQDGAF